MNWKKSFLFLFSVTIAVQAMAQPTVLVVRNCLPNNGDAVQMFLDLGAVVDEIPTDDLFAFNLTPYCVVYVTGIECFPGDPVPYQLNDAVGLLEDYVQNGGTLFYETANFETFTLPGGVMAFDWQDWENFVIEGHPIADELPWMLAANCSAMSMSRFDNLPPGFIPITISSYSEFLTTVSYPLGAGEVIATGVMGEYGMIGSNCWTQPDDTAELWMAIAAYCVSVCDPGITDLDVPEAFYMEQNYPNPFNPTTTIRFGLPEAGSVELAVYNMAGQQVMTLYDGWLPVGEHSFEFQADGLASGNYLYQLECEPGTISRQMILVK